MAPEQAFQQVTPTFGYTLVGVAEYRFVMGVAFLGEKTDTEFEN